VHSWKSFTANESNRLLGLTGSFWQREYYDHVVRGEKQFNRIMNYIVANPLKANLANWPWVYAAVR
jgi:REP element-mobilizing transposase RayT